jgi:Glycosyl transferase family 2
MTVSVVIATTGRTSLRQAVRSCVDQTQPPAEVLVVPDGPEAEARSRAALADVNDPSVKVLANVPKRNGSHARNVGTDRATQPLVAYLDDDDTWHRRKLERQTTVARERLAAGQPVVVTCRCTFRRARSSRTAVYPSQPLPPVPQIANYLVERRRPRYGATMVQTSSILIDRQTATTVRWDENLAKHQDWDFIIRAAATAQALLTAGPEPLMRVNQGSVGSISKQIDVESTQRFLAKHPAISGRARSDFLVVHVLAPSIRFGPRPSAFAALRTIASLRPIPHIGAAVVAAHAMFRRCWTLVQRS